MSRYIDADALRKEYNDWYKLFAWGDGTDAEKATIARAIQILDEQPSTDVVKCKDCIHHKPFMGAYMCDVFDWINTEDDYCSFAEREKK